MFNQDQLKSLGIATGLILLNIGIMWMFVFTPLSGINDMVFGFNFFVGVLVYGALLSGGLWISRSGIKAGNIKKAVAGTGLVQLGYGIFGAGILTMLVSPGLQAAALGITAVVSSVIALLSGLLVYGTGHDFSSWGKYANYLFLGVLGISFLGSFSGTAVMIAFVLALLGFIVYLIHQIYVTKTRPGTPFLNAIGLYTAFMGVFVEILQLVVQMLADE